MNGDQVIAEALGVILGRGFRTGLYRELTNGIAEGLNETTYPVISALARTESAAATATALADDLGLDRSVASRRAASLVDAGLIRMQTNPTDRRQVILTLTDAGEAAVATMRTRLQSAIARHIKDWPARDRDRFATALQRFAASPLRGEADTTAWGD